MPPISGVVKALKHLWDGNEWVAARGVSEFVSHTSAARTSTNSGTEFTNVDAMAALIIWDITAKSGTISLNFVLQTKDPASGKWIDIGKSGARTLIETKALSVFPSNQSIINDVVSVREFAIGRTMRINVEHGNANSATYSVGVILT